MAETGGTEVLRAPAVAESMADVRDAPTDPEWIPALPFGRRPVTIGMIIGFVVGALADIVLYQVLGADPVAGILATTAFFTATWTGAMVGSRYDRDSSAASNAQP